MNKCNYVAFHVHSQHSNGTTNIDSITDYTEYIEKAKELGMEALALSEHGNIFEWVHKKETIEKAGMKYIHAIEAYLTEELYQYPEIPNEVYESMLGMDEIEAQKEISDILEGSKKSIRDNYHCVLIARNYEGVKELNRLSSMSFNRKDGHYYYSPRITFDELFNTSDNIIITTACLGGVLHNGTGSAKEKFFDFIKRNKHRCFLEIQHHNVLDQIEYNKNLYKLNQEHKIPLIAGTDTHALNEAHMAGRKILQISKNVHFANEDEWDLTFKSYDELVRAYETQNAIPKVAWMQAIENTNRMADSIEPFTLDRNTKYPKIYNDPIGTYKSKINEAYKAHPYIKKRYKPEEIIPAIREEVVTYEKTKSIDFMLLQTYLRNWERENGIFCGYGRGSVSGSEVAYILGITEMDSKKFGLNFFRFMNPARVTNADIDTDYSSKDRDRVKRFILQDHMNLPKIKASEIITFNTIALKGAIKDVGRALNMPLEKTSAISNAVYLENGKWKIDNEYRKKYPELFKYVDLVNGTIVSIGSHPSGVLISDLDIEGEVGMCSLSTSEYPVSVLNMKELDSLMYVKLDILGLDNIGVINETCRLANIERMTPDNVDLDDEDVWKDIRDDTTLIFQWESASAQAYLKKFMSDSVIEIAKRNNKDFSYIKWFSFGNGLIRPGCASFRDDVANGNVLATGFKELDDFLAVTSGRITMQEDIMKFLVRFCGYSDAESDSVRRCVDESTLILMADGNHKMIKDVKAGDYVQCKDSSNHISYEKVLNVFNNGKSLTYKIKTQHGNELIATENHKVFTQRGWIPVSELSMNDFLMTPSKINAQCDNLISANRLSEKEMFMIGLLLGDGSTIEGQEIHFTNHELELVKKYEDCVKSRLPYGGQCDFTYSIQCGTTVEKIYSVYIKSKNYKKSTENLLRKYGLLCKAADKRIPSELMAYPKGGKIINLLAGLFSTDGGYCNGGLYIDYSSTSKILVLQIKSLLLKYGIYSYISKSKVKEYGHYSYRLVIAQKKSLKLFDEYIIPAIVGKKKFLFASVVNKKNKNPKSYNYMLPNECKNEILDSFVNSGTSLRSVGARIGNSDFAIHKSEFGISDEKAAHVINDVYCPKTYELLMADYIPVRVKSIEKYKVSNVYDIEVDKCHNYIANGLIVHNCIAKKYGTENVIDEIHDRFINYSNEKYGKEKADLEEIFPPIKQGILDATRYAFSWNHSDAYSCVGYICGYLRHYYPLEFLTAALNVFEGKEEKTLNITAYAKDKGIKIEGIKFRYSTSEYACDKERNTIYKGIASIKYLNDKVANAFQKIKGAHFDSFVELLWEIETMKFPVNSKQMGILIELNFFEEFGEIKELKKQYYYFSELYGKKQMKKDKMESLGIPIEILRNNSKRESEKSFLEVNMLGVLCDFIKYMPFEKTKFIDIARYQQKNLGYIDAVNPEYKGVVAILDVEKKYTPKVNVYALANGNTLTVKIPKKDFNKSPVQPGDIILVNQQIKKNTVKISQDGKFVPVPNEYDWWITDYKIIKEREDVIR